MYEFLLALKYLVPSRKNLSVSIIASISTVVISLVVWLTITFLSVTEGIESIWTHKLTSLSGEIRIHPTARYFESYYHQVDQFSSQSNYQLKTLAQKYAAPSSDPYREGIDPNLPPFFPEAESKDLVKEMKQAVDRIIQKEALSSSFFDSATGLLTIQTGGKNISQLVFATSAHFEHLPSDQIALSPKRKDLTLLAERLLLANPSFFLTACSQVKLYPKSHLLPLHLFPKEFDLKGFVSPYPEEANFFFLEKTKPHLIAAKLSHQNEQTILFVKGKKQPCTKMQILSEKTPFSITSIQDRFLKVQSNIGKINLQGLLPIAFFEFDGLNLEQALSWLDEITPATSEKIFLPKQYLLSGASLGDQGTISIQSYSFSGTVELKVPVVVAGFYDPGLFSMGARMVVGSERLVQLLSNRSEQELLGVDPMGYQIHLKQAKNTHILSKKIEKALQEAHLSPYFKVTPYWEYDFVKEIMKQYKSDRYLFTLIAVMIIFVACSNIVAFLLMLVQSKKHDIAILRSLGATRLSIAKIFSICASTIALFSISCGLLFAYITMKNLPSLLAALSYFQGHSLLNPIFFGTTLPSHLSFSAIQFIGILTPIVALLSALLPAFQASKLQPIEVLKS